MELAHFLAEKGASIFLKKMGFPSGGAFEISPAGILGVSKNVT